MFVASISDLKDLKNLFLSFLYLQMLPSSIFDSVQQQGSHDGGHSILLGVL